MARISFFYSLFIDEKKMNSTSSSSYSHITQFDILFSFFPLRCVVFRDVCFVIIQLIFVSSPFNTFYVVKIYGTKTVKIKFSFFRLKWCLSMGLLLLHRIYFHFWGRARCSVHTHFLATKKKNLLFWQMASVLALSVLIMCLGVQMNKKKKEKEKENILLICERWMNIEKWWRRRKRNQQKTSTVSQPISIFFLPSEFEISSSFSSNFLLLWKI